MAGALTRDTVSWLLALSTPSHCMPSDTTRAMPPVDIQLLLDALLRHGVMPLAVDQVHRFPELTALQEPLRAAQAANAGRALASVAHIAATAAAFDAAGIPWCVLKGVPLALRHYGDLAARQVGDIDILAPPATPRRRMMPCAAAAGNAREHRRTRPCRRRATGTSSAMSAPLD